MGNKLTGKKVAVLMADGFEEVEFTKPCSALEEEGAEVVVVAPEAGLVKAWDKDHWGGSYSADLSLADAEPEAFDALLLPGGVMNPDHLRGNAQAVRFVSEFIEAEKPIAAICHAPQLLIETQRVRGRRMTSYPSVQTDLKNAGVEWVNEEVVVDQGIVTSRKPADIPAFNDKMIEAFCQGRQRGQQVV